MAPSKAKHFRSTGVETSVFQLGDNLLDFIVRNLPADRLPERSVLAVTSKIVSLSESCVIYKKDVPSKRDLVRREADHFLADASFGTTLTIKHGLFIPAAGIDESNAQGDFYILFPPDPFASARRLHEGLCAHYGRRELGVLLTDSHTHPLRKGVTGIGLAHWGFRAVRSLVGTGDLFGRELKMTNVNVIDALAVAAVYVMGEADESCPLAVIEDSSVEFTAEAAHPQEIRIPWQDDLYRVLYEQFLEKETNPGNK